MNNSESKALEQKPSMYALIAKLVIAYQLCPEDWNLGPMTRKNARAINKHIERHNESLKKLAIDLKDAYETHKRSVTPKSEIE